MTWYICPQRLCDRLMLMERAISRDNDGAMLPGKRGDCLVGALWWQFVANVPDIEMHQSQGSGRFSRPVLVEQELHAVRRSRRPSAFSKRTAALIAATGT